METNNLKAIYFDGESYILFSRFANFPKNSLTIEFWVKKETKNCRFLEFVDDDLVKYNTDLAFSFVEDKLVVSLFDIQISTLYALDNAWHHVAFTYKSFDKETPFQTFVDGYPIDYVKINADFSNLNYSGKGDLYIGRKDNDKVFEGYIRNLRIWNASRTGLEVRQKMSITLMDFEDLLVGMWNFASMNEIESKLGVRLPQSFADQEKKLALAIKNFNDTSTPNDKNQGLTAVNDALKSALDIIKISSTTITDDEDKVKLNEIRLSTIQPAFGVRKEAKSGDLKVEQLEKVSASIKDGLVEATKISDVKSLLSDNLDSLFSAEKDWFRIYINNEPKTCIINLSKSPLENSITLDLQNVSSRNIDIDNSIKIQIGLRNLLPPDQINEIKKSKGQYPVDRILNEIGTSINDNKKNQILLLKSLSFEEQLVELKKMDGIPQEVLEKIEGFKHVKNNSLIELSLGNALDDYTSECLWEYQLSPTGEDTLEIKFKENFILERNGKISFRFKNIFAGDTSREGYIVVEIVQQKKGIIQTILSTQAIFGVFLLPFLGRLPLENGIVGRNELYYPSEKNASIDKIKSELVFYFANPGLDGLISKSSLKNGQLSISSHLKFETVDASVCKSKTFENKDNTETSKWGKFKTSEQSNLFKYDFDLKLDVDTAFMFESLEVLIIRITGFGDPIYSEFIPLTFKFDGFGGYNQTIFEFFVRNTKATSNFNTFNDIEGDKIGIGVSNPLINLAIGQSKMGFNAEANSSLKAEFETINKNELNVAIIGLNDLQAKLTQAKDNSKPDPEKVAAAELAKKIASEDLEKAMLVKQQVQEDFNENNRLFNEANEKVSKFNVEKQLAESKVSQSQYIYDQAVQNLNNIETELNNYQNSFNQAQNERDHFQRQKDDSYWSMGAYDEGINNASNRMAECENQINNLRYQYSIVLNDKNTKERDKNQIETEVYNALVSVRNAEQFRDSLKPNFDDLKSKLDSYTKKQDDSNSNFVKASDQLNNILNASTDVVELRKKIDQLEAKINEIRNRKLLKNEIVIYTDDLDERLRINKEGISVKGAIKSEGRITDKTGFLMPVGSIIAYGASNPPQGWLLCDGTTISDEKYFDLKAVLGSSNVPDLRSRFILGAGNSYSLGSLGGEENHLLSINEMPRHQHFGFGESRSDWPLGVSSDVNKGSKGDVDDDNYLYGTTEAGGGGSHNNMPPYFALTYIIKY